VGSANTLLVRLAGSKAPAKATVTVYAVTAGLNDENSLTEPHKIHPVESTLPYARDLAIKLAPYTVAVVEVRAE
jgi:alpha-N-arabinofuranosidase